MPTFQFMPWCRIDKKYKACDIEVIPFNRDGKIPEINELESSHAKRILSAYKNIEGHGVEKAALIKIRDNDIFADLSEEEKTETSEVIELFSFSGLANREHFRGDMYCNSEHFTMYGHQFRDGPDYLALQSRRATGYQIDGGRALAEVVFSIPVHCNGLSDISLDNELLEKLSKHRDEKPESEWGRWQNAISSYNLANTDNSLFRDQVEWVLLSSAFEHLLDAQPNAKNVAEKFAETFVPNQPIPIKEAKRKSERWQIPEQHLRYEWMKEFYSVRGSFAHGKLQPRIPMAWSPIEHLALAKIAFPLLVRILLDKESSPPLPDDYKREVDIFEKLANETFLKMPQDASNSYDTHWARALADHGKEKRIARIAEMLSRPSTS